VAVFRAATVTERVPSTRCQGRGSLGAWCGGTPTPPFGRRTLSFGPRDVALWLHTPGGISDFRLQIADWRLVGDEVPFGVAEPEVRTARRPEGRPATGGLLESCGFVRVWETCGQAQGSVRRPSPSVLGRPSPSVLGRPSPCVTFAQRARTRPRKAPLRGDLMTSARQIEANQSNALMSTGPRTPEGKAASCANALKHGLTATTVAVLPCEDGEQFDGLRERVRQELAPVGAVEGELVERIAAAFWRLRRVETIETGVLGWQMAQHVVDEAQESIDEEKRALLREHRGESVNFADWWPFHEFSEDTQEECARRWEALRFQGLAAPALGRAFQKDAEGPNSFDRLGRYERGIQTGLLKSLQMLAEVQARREGLRTNGVRSQI